MKIYKYETLLRENGTCYISECQGYTIDGRANYNSPSLVYDLVRQLNLCNSADEKVYCICLNSICRAIGLFEVSHGGSTSSQFNTRELFRTALLIGAYGIVLIHNHPSGDVTPSKDDIVSTQNLVNAGKVIGINLFDHVIVSIDGYCSLQQENYL